MEFSIDCKYLYVCCGIPEQELIVIDLKKRRKLSASSQKSQGIEGLEKAFSSDSSIKIDQNCPVKKIKINPGNEKMFAIMFETAI